MSSSLTILNADLKNTNFENIDFSEANLAYLNLHNTHFKKVNLSQANLSNTNLTDVDLSESILSRANLTYANFSGVNLKNSVLPGANLFETILNQADISFADFSSTNLNNACLYRVYAVGTNFTNTDLTGACIEDWKIDGRTNLDNVTCDYIYLKRNKQERRPYSGNFLPGEFTKLFQKFQTTVELIFLHGINWQAFLNTFRKLQIQCSNDELAIQAIERKSDGAFVIRVKVPPDANKDKLKKYLKQDYDQEVKNLEEKYLLQLNAKQEEITIYRKEIQSLSQDKTKLLDIMEIMAKKNNSKVNMKFKAPVTGATGNVEGDQTIYASVPEETSLKKTETQTQKKNLWTHFVTFLSIGQGTQFVITIALIILGLIAGIITVFLSPSDFHFFQPNTEQIIQEQPLD